MTTHLWLVRHGQIVLPDQKTFIGQQDLPLTSLGRKQMQDLKVFFEQKNLDIVLCSNLKRCLNGANLLCPKSVPIVADVNFQEINLGTWQGQTIKAIKNKYPLDYLERGNNIHSYRPQNGESFQDVESRVMSTLKAYLEKYKGKNIALIAHAGVNRIIIANYLNLHLKYLLSIPQPYGCCTSLIFK